MLQFKSGAWAPSLILPSTAAAAKSLQSCLTLCDPIDGSPRGSPVPGILQARTLEWVAISFSNAWKWKVKVKPLSRARLLATPWTRAYQAPPSMGFSRQEYWSGVPLPSPIFLYWSIIDTQCCISFCYTAKWISYTYIYIYIYISLSPLFCKLLFHVGHYRLLSRAPCAIQ